MYYAGDSVTFNNVRYVALWWAKSEKTDVYLYGVLTIEMIRM
ncbi:hypothetical protein C0W92_09220 [Photobacterium angustum]|nr:hypothetical protein C0W92_09220 [Photobacterium angustum]